MPKRGFRETRDGAEQTPGYPTLDRFDRFDRTRRAFLRDLGLVMGGGVLVGCGHRSIQSIQSSDAATRPDTRPQLDAEPTADAEPAPDRGHDLPRPNPGYTPVMDARIDSDP